MKKEKMLRKCLAFCLAGSIVGGVVSPFAAQKVWAASTDLYVGYSNQSMNYGTVQEAVNRAASINPASENDRVTIHIAPGTYREQILVSTPYISFVNDNPSQQVLLTWYYGIGYKYYSCDSSGVYNANSAAAKNAKNEPTTRWGYGVRVSSKANYFRAENITFENSFNRYITNEEIADGVEPSESQSINFQRVKGADVNSKAATERAAALSLEGDYCELYQCKLLSSQDTFYLGGNNGYIKDCLIEGNTDYIYGQGNYIFQDCELSFKGYSSNSVGGYITAIRDAGHTLFYNCSVTANGSLTVSPGYFGRPWGAAADVAFVNTQLQYESIIKDVGWTSMSGNAPENAKYKEYGTKANGVSVNTSKRVNGTVRYSDEGLNVATYLNGWTPYYQNHQNQNPSQVETIEKLVAVLNADTLTKGDYKSEYQVGDYFSVTASEEKSISISERSVSSSDGTQYSSVIALGGAGTTAYRSVKINATGAGSLKVDMGSSSSTDLRTVYLMNQKGTVIQTIENVAGMNLTQYTMQIPSAGTYYLTSAGSGLNVGRIQLYLSTEFGLLGDLDEDDALSAFDYALLKARLLNQSSYEKKADMNCDGTISLADVVMMHSLLQINHK